MKLLLTILLLVGPVNIGSVPANSEPTMSCVQVKEVASVILDSPVLSKEDKIKILQNLVGKHGMACIQID